MVKKCIKTRWVGTVQIDLECPADSPGIRPIDEIREIVMGGTFTGNVKAALLGMVSGEGDQEKTSVSVTQTYGDVWPVTREDEDGPEV